MTQQPTHSDAELLAVVEWLYEHGHRDYFAGGIAPAVLAEHVEYSREACFDRLRELARDGPLTAVRGHPRSAKRQEKPRLSYLPPGVSAADALRASGHDVREEVTGVYD